MDYIQSVDYFHSLLAFGVRPGLERINKLLSLLGNPQDKLKIIHIAGTNGKGSTSQMLYRMLLSEGKTAGLFTSPYVFDFCERIGINGSPVSHSTLARYATAVREKIEELNSQGIIITEFEAITAAAFLCFYREGCEYAVTEVGLGGRFDATNTVNTPLVSVITSISLDHTAILGDTLSKIAFEKCGIIKEGAPVVTSANQTNEALEVIRETAEEKHSPLTVTAPASVRVIFDSLEKTEFSYNGEAYEIHLTGKHQLENAVNAIETAKILGLNSASVKEGLKAAYMPARMEVISKNPLVIRDGGHNEGCGKALREFLLKYGVKNISMLIGLMADKDAESYVELLAPLCREAVTVTPSNPRRLQGEGLQKIVRKYCDSVICIDEPKKAYDYLLSKAEKDSTVLVCGSFYMMGDIFTE